MRRDGGVWPRVRDGLEQSRDTHVELGRVDNEDDSSGSALPHHLVALASARPFPYPSVTAVSSNSYSVAGPRERRLSDGTIF